MANQVEGQVMAKIMTLEPMLKPAMAEMVDGKAFLLQVTSSWQKQPRSQSEYHPLQWMRARL